MKIDSSSQAIAVEWTWSFFLQGWVVLQNISFCASRLNALFAAPILWAMSAITSLIIFKAFANSMQIFSKIVMMP